MRWAGYDDTVRVGAIRRAVCEEWGDNACWIREQWLRLRWMGLLELKLQVNRWMEEVVCFNGQLAGYRGTLRCFA